MRENELNCGIYKIENKIDARVLVGSTVNLKRRKKEHFVNLRGNRHPNKYLQNAYNEYGEKDLEFTILLYCAENDLDFYGQRAMDVYKAADRKYGYNISPVIGRGTEGCRWKLSEEEKRKYKWSEERKRKFSENRKGKSSRRDVRAEDVFEKRKEGLTISQLANFFNTCDMTIKRRLRKYNERDRNSI